MATIGHTFVGLALSQFDEPRRPPESANPGPKRIPTDRSRHSTVPSHGYLYYAWPGIMVLAAHLVDIVEWAVRIIAAESFRTHFVTNSLKVTGGAVAASWLILFIFSRASARRSGEVLPLMGYLLVGVAIFSHLLLDLESVREGAVTLYGLPVGANAIRFERALFCECWLYGLLFVLAALATNASRPGVSGAGRRAAWVLAGAAVMAAATRHAWIWVPIYGLASMHAVLLGRRRLSWRYLWSLVPVMPILALGLVEWWAGVLFARADALDAMQNCREAVTVYRRAFVVPTRSSHSRQIIRLSDCQLQIGDIAGAERTLQRGIRHEESNDWVYEFLAELYVDPRVHGTPFYRPDEAARRLRAIVADDRLLEAVRADAKVTLERLRAKGVIAP